MNKKIYDLMNWPEIEGIVYSECDAPSALLGGHVCEDGFLIQAFRPDAVEIQVSVEGKKRKYQMEKVDEAGYFACIIPGKRVQKYTLTVENLKGKKDTYIDPYSCSYQHNDKYIKAFLTGDSCDAYKWLGSHVTRLNGVKGTIFTVWAPDALRVSVVGEFNHWDGRIFQMDRIKATGIFQLFVPGIADETEYFYEIKKRGGDIFLKSDPYANRYAKDNRYASVVCENRRMEWQDSEWMKNRTASQSELTQKQPVSIYEMQLGQIPEPESIAAIADYVKELGFTHVELMPVCEYISDYSLGYETLGYFALTDRVGKDHDFAAFVDAMHQRGIGVIIDWNAAFMGRDKQGLCWFDGAAIYESGVTQLGDRSDLNVASFDYTRPEVRSFLQSSLMYWVSRFHIDGVRIDEAASMLYLNYGKKPGEWKANIYGGCENLEAVALLKNLRQILDKKAKGILLIAEENSCWPKVTGKDQDALGFDYKWNDGWKKDLVDFIRLDPLFRKGRYDTLTHSMLYHYSETYLLEFSHKTVDLDKNTLFNILPGNQKKDKIDNLRAVLGYLYFYPGKKLVCEDLCRQVPQEFIQMLNQTYCRYPQLYELDYDPEGFEWADNCSVEETVIAFYRKATNSQDLLVVTNFTPVVRSDYEIGVEYAGKYREIFNSDSKEYGGSDVGNSGIMKSEKRKCNGKDHVIRLTLPPMSTIVLNYTPFTAYELEESRIKDEAIEAKKQAAREAENALALKIRAELEAKEAFEAEETAKAAAQAAQDAKLEAERKADEAERLSQQIEEETGKRLEELKKKYNR